MQRLVVAAVALGHVLAEPVQCAVIEGIEALADDVEVDVGVGEVVEVPLGDGPVAAAVDVDYNLDGLVGGGGPHAAHARLDQPDEVLPLLGIIVGIGEGLDSAGVHLDVGVRDLHVAQRPEHAAGDFVAHLDHVGHDARLLELRDQVLAIFLDLLFESVHVEVPPGNRSFLMLRVGPGVGIVDVEQEHRAGRFDLFRQLNGVFEIVVRSLPYRRDEHSQAERVPPVTVHDVDFGVGLAVFLVVIEKAGASAASAPAGERRDVGTEIGKRPGRRSRVRRAGRPGGLLANRRGRGRQVEMLVIADAMTKAGQLRRRVQR